MLRQCLLKSHVAVLLCLALLSTALSGCTRSVVTKTNYLYPPAAYLVSCERTEFSGKTYADAIDYLMIVIKERDLCASQIDRIREWQAQTKQGFK
ncbi:Rz1-like lysis system protein LysC [Mannheimia granulomatis]|uniref:Rz1-like lysis system protein LysC n=1 Tax=Mannheimia granulomatis TaxID=85402 RepID=UPI003B635589